MPKASAGTVSGITLAIANISSALSSMLSGGPGRPPGISPMFIATSRIAPDSTLAMVAL
ncbi:MULTISPECIES: hypothetical protein [Tatumella]|uniref:hypothetical protein n=1 Tax=Tatumella TaxID=82986 RepID=UPI001364E17B|nr:MULTISPECIES: hypothetical protein [Tatumella]